MTFDISLSQPLTTHCLFVTITMERVQATRDHEYDVATYLLVGCIADLFNVMIWLNIQYARSESMMFNVQVEYSKAKSNNCNEDTKLKAT